MRHVMRVLCYTDNMGKFGALETYTANPFTPSFGETPQFQVGNEELLYELSEGFALGPEDERYASILLGPRGSGKTILLQTIEDIANDEGWIVLPVKASKRGLQANIEEAIDLVYEGRSKSPLQPKGSTSVQTGTSIKSGSIKWHRDAIKTSYKHQKIRTKLTKMAECAEDEGSGVMLIVDEIHSGNRGDLKDLALDIQRITRSKNLPLGFLGAGLPEIKRTLLRDKNITFFHRCTQFDMPLLSPSDVRAGLILTVEHAKGAITDEALDVFESVQCLPYHLQLLGSYAWKIAKAPSNRIDAESAMLAVEAAQEDMYQLVFMKAWDDLNENEQAYLRVLSGLGGQASQYDMGEQLSLPHSTQGRVEDYLVDVGYINRIIGVSGNTVKLTGLMPIESITRRGMEHRFDRSLQSGLVLPLASRQICSEVMPRAQARCVLTKGHKGGHRSR